MVTNEWLLDLPQQFLGKRNIEILIGAFAKQLDELYKVFSDINTLTTLEAATGQSLRNISDILSLTEKEIQEILMGASSKEITDETYRKVLQYKALKNNCDCTYYDIMESISLLWDTDNLRYTEKSERPATIFIELPEVSIDGMDPAVGKVLAIKPGGVAMLYSNGFVAGVNISGLEKVSVSMIKFGLWYLDGSYLLDGTKKLSSERIEEDL